MALQSHINLLRSYGFDCSLVEVDPQSALNVLVGCFPGTEIDLGGSGDKEPKVDEKLGVLRKLVDM